MNFNSILIKLLGPVLNQFVDDVQKFANANPLAKQILVKLNEFLTEVLKSPSG